jgi:hypothetical protein
MTAWMLFLIFPLRINELLRSSLGGALEFYDFVIYVFYAKRSFRIYFFQALSPFWAMLNTYGIFAAGYFFRPLAVW